MNFTSEKPLTRPHCKATIKQPIRVYAMITSHLSPQVNALLPIFLCSTFVPLCPTSMPKSANSFKNTLPTRHPQALDNSRIYPLQAHTISTPQLRPMNDG